MKSKFINSLEIDKKFLRLIENGHSGVILLNKKSEIIYQSPSAARISGWPGDAISGEPLETIIHSSDKDLIRSVLEDAAAAAFLANTVTAQVERQDGSSVWLKCTITNMLADPEIEAVVCNIIDITPEKYSNILLNQTIRKLSDYKSALDISAIVSITDQNGIIKYVNDNFCTISQYSERELLGSDHRIIKSSNHSSSFFEDLWANISSGKMWKGEVKNKAKDGSFFWVDMTIVPLLGNDGKPYQYISIDFDITDRKESQAKEKQAQQEVESKTEQIDNLLENIAEGFIALDHDLNYVYANKQIGKMLGRDPASLIGKNIWKVFPDAVGSQTYFAIQLALEKKEPITNEDYYAPIQLWQENRVYPTKNGLSIFIRDITIRKREELQKELLSSIGQIFTEQADLAGAMNVVLKDIAENCSFCMAEAWLISTDRKSISLTAKYSGNENVKTFFEVSKDINTFYPDQGMPGKVWKSKKTTVWDLNKPNDFARLEAATSAGIQMIYGVPLKFGSDIVGVLVLGSLQGDALPKNTLAMVEEIASQVAPEVHRKQIETELHHIFNYAPDIICVAGKDGYIKKINPATTQIMGYSEEELINVPLVELVVTGEQEKLSRGLSTLFLENRVLSSENQCVTKSGRIKTLSWSIAPATSEGLLYVVAKDVTEQKELQNILKKANDLARIGGWEVDLKTNKIQWSDITREIHEVGPDYEPDMKSGIEFYRKGTSRDIISAKIRESVETGNSWDLELQIKTAKGNFKWVRVIGEVEMEAGKCSRLYGSFQDIDVRKRAEIAAKEALEDRNTILESIDDAFFAVDKDWTVTYWNNKAEQVLMTPKSSILHKKLWDIFSGSIDSLSYQNYHKALQTNQVIQFEDYFEPLNRWYEISAYPADNGLSVFFKDITDRKNDLIELKQLNVRLEKRSRDLALSNAELEQYAYVASHDLQEPLRMVTNFLDLFERQYRDIVDERGKKYIHFAVDGAKRMRQIILDLLEYSRVGRYDDVDEPVDFNEVVGNILALYKKEIQEKNASVTFDHLPTITMNKVPVRQVLQNLISNALKYQSQDSRPEIRIQVSDEGDKYRFAVSDNGIGIKGEYFNKIFVLFQRLHNKDEYSGTGMGLAMTKKIIQNSGGKIWLESEIGKGSTFYFTLPKNTL